MLFVRETLTNEDEDYIFSDGDYQEAFTDDRGRLFRFCQKEFGRCMSSVYVDTPEGTKKVGWYFEKTDHYEDTGEPYKRGVWIDIREEPDPAEIAASIEEARP